MPVDLFYHTIFILTLCSCLQMMQVPLSRRYVVNVPGQVFVIFLFIFVALCLGVLPVRWLSGEDRELYANQFLDVQQGFILNWEQDKLFGMYMKFMGYFCNYQIWFILTAFIYCFNHYFFSVRITKKYAYILLLMFFSSFMFYSYGTNTIRAGFAASFLLLSLIYYKRITFFLFFIMLAVACHFSMSIPALAMILSRYFDKTKLYIYVWLLFVVLSAVMGGYFEVLFSSMAADSRTSYLTTSAEDTHYKVGFRIDFVLYSCLPLIMGYYYVIKKQFNDRFYSLLLNTYILANCFWILVIRANFSDRFAYLSWFIYPAVLIYPLFKVRIWRNQYKKIALIVLLNEIFTYIMFLR